MDKTLKAQIEEARRHVDSIKDTAVRAQSRLDALLKEANQPEPKQERQATLRECNETYLAQDKVVREEKDSALGVATKALKAAFNPAPANRKRRTQKNLRHA